MRPAAFAGCGNELFADFNGASLSARIFAPVTACG
jgi:hypothetical protein